MAICINTLITGGIGFNPISEPEQRDTTFKVQTTSSYKKSGIYSAQRDDTTKPVVLDWGDGTVEEVNGNVSQKVHTYATVGEFEATISNIKTFAASSSSSAWYNTTSRNRYTLKEVVIGSSVTTIGDDTFYYCSSLTSVTIPDSVTSIGMSMFHNCSALTSVTIGNNVTSIGWTAFEYCSRLTSVTIPASVTSIGQGVFSGCSWLTSVTFEGKTLSQIQSMINYSTWFVNAGPNVTIIGSDGSIVVNQTNSGGSGA